MDWNLVFSATNMFALIAWAALLLLPRWPALLSAVLYLGVGLLCLAYTLGLAGIVSGLLAAGGSAGETGANFTTIEGVRAIFSSDGGVTVGWMHYLAFDLFAGLWIARDADAKSISRFIQAPILVLTLMAGPAGLLVWLILREPAARRQGRFR